MPEEDMPVGYLFQSPSGRRSILGYGRPLTKDARKWFRVRGIKFKRIW